MAASPIVAGNLLILICDQNTNSFVIALDKDSGEKRWKTARREHREGWAVPIVHEDQLITVGTNRVESYHLSTGEPRWWMTLPSYGSMGSPVVHGANVIVTSQGADDPWIPSWAAVIAKLDTNKDGKLTAEECKDEKDWGGHFPWIDADHDKFVTSAEWDEAAKLGIGEWGAVAIPLASRGRVEKPVWRVKRNVPYIPSPILVNGVFFMVKTGGIVTALDPATGEIRKQGRSEKALGEYYASPVSAAGRIYIANEEGKISVLKAGAQWEVLAVNDLGEEVRATPALGSDAIFIRTREHLYVFRGSSQSGSGPALKKKR